MKFTAKKVRDLFLRELKSYAVDQSFCEYVVESPRSRKFKTTILKNEAPKTRHRWMWVVLDRNPSQSKGRCVTFDPRTMSFALAEKTTDWKYGQLIGESHDLASVLDPMEL